MHHPDIPRLPVLRFARCASSIATLSLPLLLSLTSCQVLNRLSGNDTIDLSRATVRQMTVSLRKPEQTICPRE